MRVTRSDFADAQGRIPLRLLTVEGGGHTWPGGRRAPRQKGTQDISANDELLRFFALWP
jgi:polyhydroxybutyrate depolymerase